MKHLLYILLKTDTVILRQNGSSITADLEVKNKTNGFKNNFYNINNLKFLCLFVLYPIMGYMFHFFIRQNEKMVLSYKNLFCLSLYGSFYFIFRFVLV